MAFESNVFINCPFDREYRTLLKPLLFTILYLEYKPKISQNNSSSDIRINQIKSFIRDSKFGIHDLSRCKPLRDGDLPRFNMPYELGLDIGCCEFGSKELKKKKILILETDRFHYQKILSDIAGQDIENHDDNPQVLIKKVRNWFSSMSSRKIFPNPNKIWTAYNQFDSGLNEELKAQNYPKEEIVNMPIEEFIKFASSWINSFKRANSYWS
jgi:hypothetical protein